MSEAPVAPTAAARDSGAAVKESEPAAGAPEAFGVMLRTARVAAGMSAAALAARLRLHIKQVEALESGALDALPGPVYVRGFLRSCARELKIDSRPLLADLDRRIGAQPCTQARASRATLPWSRLGESSRPILLLLVVVLVLAGIVGRMQPRHNAPPLPVTGWSGTAQRALAANAGVPSATVTTLAPAALAPIIADAGGAAAVATAPTVASYGANAVAAPALAPPPVADDHLRAAATVPGADASALVFTLKSDSWIEVVDAAGLTVFSQLCPAGSVQAVHAQAPLRIVVGNAKNVEAQFRGLGVDLNRYANANGVARFTLQ